MDRSPQRRREDAAPLSNGSLPDVAVSFTDNSFVNLIVLNVVRHYKMAGVCVSLESPTHMHLKACYGMSTSIQEKTSITRHFGGRDLPIIMDDASKEEHVMNDPLVQGDPFIRFFVAAPLKISATECVGSLCMMSPEPASHQWQLDDCEFLVQSANRLAQHCKDAVEKAKLSVPPHGGWIQMAGWQMSLNTLPSLNSLPCLEDSDPLQEEIETFDSADQGSDQTSSRCGPRPATDVWISGTTAASIKCGPGRALV